MNFLKKKEGSIVIGMLLLVAMLIPFLIFAYESALLFVVKEKSQRIADNTSYSAVLEVDDDILWWYKTVQIDESDAISVARKVFKESYDSSKENAIFKEPMLQVYILNNPNDKVTIRGKEYQSNNPAVISSVEFEMKDELFFFKDIKIQSVSKSQVYEKTDLTWVIGFRLLPKEKRYEYLRFENR